MDDQIIAQKDAQRKEGYTMTAEQVGKLRPELTSEAVQEVANYVNRCDPLTKEEAERIADWIVYVRLPFRGKQRYARSH